MFFRRKSYQAETSQNKRSSGDPLDWLEEDSSELCWAAPDMGVNARWRRLRRSTMESPGLHGRRARILSSARPKIRCSPRFSNQGLARFATLTWIRPVVPGPERPVAQAGTQDSATMKAPYRPSGHRSFGSPNLRVTRGSKVIEKSKPSKAAWSTRISARMAPRSRSRKAPEGCATSPTLATRAKPPSTTTTSSSPPSPSPSSTPATSLQTTTTGRTSIGSGRSGFSTKSMSCCRTAGRRTSSAWPAA